MRKATITLNGEVITMQYNPSSVRKRFGKVHNQTDDLSSQPTVIGENNTLTADVEFYRTAELPYSQAKSPAFAIGSGLLAVAGSMFGSEIQNIKQKVTVAKGIFDQVSGVVSEFSDQKPASTPKRKDDYTKMLEELNKLQKAASDGSVVEIDIDLLKDHNGDTVPFLITGIQSTVEAMDDSAQSIMVKTSMELKKVDKDNLIRVGTL